MIHDIFLALWFFLPAGLANTAPIFAAQVPQLKKYDAPIDGGLVFRGRRLLGAHKTWRGLLFGAITAIAVLWVQQQLAGSIGWLRTWTQPLDYAHLGTVSLGILLGIGALGGDALKSFFKRRFNIAPGKTWFPFDQVDYIAGASLATCFVVALPLLAYVCALILWPAIHIASTQIGYVLGLKEERI